MITKIVEDDKSIQLFCIDKGSRLYVFTLDGKNLLDVYLVESKVYHGIYRTIYNKVMIDSLDFEEEMKARNLVANYLKRKK